MNGYDVEMTPNEFVSAVIVGSIIGAAVVIGLGVLFPRTRKWLWIVSLF